MTQQQIERHGRIGGKPPDEPRDPRRLGTHSGDGLQPEELRPAPLGETIRPGPDQATECRVGAPLIVGQLTPDVARDDPDVVGRVVQLLG